MKAKELQDLYLAILRCHTAESVILACVPKYKNLKADGVMPSLNLNPGWRIPRCHSSRVREIDGSLLDPVSLFCLGLQWIGFGILIVVELLAFLSIINQLVLIHAVSF
jgi:hypothetical protein